MSKAQFGHEYKVIVVGKVNVGKSSLVLRFTRGEFLNAYDPTLADSYRRQCLIDNEVASLDVLDTADQCDYEVLPLYLMGPGEGYLIVYSITSRASFGVVNNFHQEVLRLKGVEGFPVVLVGNKCDREVERQVSTNEGQELASSLHYQFIETSAKNDTNVHEAFALLVRAMRNHHGQHSKDTYSDSSADSESHSLGRSPRCIIL